MRRHTVRLGATSLLAALSCFMIGCAGGGSTATTTTTTTPPTAAAAPTVSSVAPATAAAGTAALTLTVNGANFTTASTVQVGTVAEVTTFVSATQLTATVPAVQLATGAILPVIVLNGSSASAPGTAVSLEIDNPAPTIASFTPLGLAVSSPATTLALAGTGFVPTTTVTVNGTSRTTAFISTTQVNINLTVADLAAAGTLSIAAVNPAPGGGTSAASSLPVNNLLPSIASLAPSAVAAGTATPTALTITGTAFAPATAVSVNGTARATTFVSPTQVSITLTPADLATAGTLSITASNPAPGGGTSSAASLPVNNPVPTVTGITPALAIAGNTSPTPITVTGTNFVTKSTVMVGTVAHATTYVSATQVTAALTPAEVATTGRLAITVVNAAPGGGTSNVLYLPVSQATATPVLTSLQPTTLLVGSADSTLYVYGSNLNLNCQVLWNSTPLTFGISTGGNYVGGTYVYSTYAVATVPASLLSATATATVTANCPTAPVPLSNALTVAVTNPPVPTLSGISPGVAAVGTSVKLTFTGKDFTSKSTVAYNGTTLATAFVSSTSLTATLPASMNVLPGNASFTVITPAPGGGTSAAVPFTAYAGLVNNDMIFNPVSGLFYASVPSSAGAPYGNSVVSIDPATGAIGTPIPVGSEPNHLAVTADGKYLWVGLDGANAVRKVDLAAGKAGLQFALPSQQVNSVGGPNAYALAALPGATDSVIVSSANFPNYFAIYDSGVVRGKALGGYYTQPYAIAVDGTRSEIYASGYSGYQTFTYDASGLTLKAAANGSISVQYGGDMQVTGGRLYPSDGKVYDAESGALQGTLYITGSTIASGSTFADPTLNKIFVTDSSNGQFYYGQNQIQIFNATDYTTTSVLPFVSDQSTSAPSRLTRWGSNGIAFRTPSGLYSFRSNLIKDLSGVSADLGVTLASSGTATTSPVTFTATVTNAGTAAATSVIFAGVPPSNGTLVSATASTGTCSTGTSLTCDLGALASGASATVTVSVQPSTAGNLVFAAQVAGSENDPVATNNNASLTVAVTGADYSAAPVVSSISPSAIKAGSADTTLTLTGTGFTSGSVVSLGTTTLTSKLVSSTQITATVPAASLASMGWAPVTVANTAPGGGTSAPTPLTVFNVVSAGLNHIAYEPFSRKLFASVGSGSSTLTGNSIAQLTPETGTFNTPVGIGSQPTRFAITNDGAYLYATLSGANSIARFNIATNATEFTFSPTVPSYYSSTTGFTDVAAQPGSDTVLAVNYGSYSGVGLVDVDATNKTGTLRGGTLTNSYSSYSSGSMQFADPNTLYISDGALERYPVPAAGLSSSTAHTGATIQYFNSFALSGKYAFGDAGGFADISGTTPVQVGYFRPISGSYFYNQKVAPDADLGRAFFATTTSSSTSVNDGIVGYDLSTQLATLTLPLGIATIEGNSSYTVTDLVRWGQDGLALLTSSGHVYLLRGAAVVPQLLGTGTAATLTASSSTAANHGAGNTLLTLTGSNFLPGMAIYWNGSYRTTTVVDSTHVTAAIGAADLATAGSATLTAVNPNAAASGGLTFTIN